MSTKTYTVQEFYNKYNTVTSDQIKDSMIASVMNIHYVPYEENVDICETIINNSYYSTIEKNGVKTKKLHTNSPARYMMYCLYLIKTYTYITVDFKNMVEEFNILNQSNLLDMLCGNIPEKEDKEFNMLLTMVENDLIQNEYEAHAFISKQIERFGGLFGHIVEPMVSKFDEIMKNIDYKAINKIINKSK